MYVQGVQHRGSAAYQARASPIRPAALHYILPLNTAESLFISIKICLDSLNDIERLFLKHSTKN